MTARMAKRRYKKSPIVGELFDHCSAVSRRDGKWIGPFRPISATNSLPTESASIRHFSLNPQQVFCIVESSASLVRLQAYWPIKWTGELRQNGPCSRDLLKKKWLTLISATPRSPRHNGIRALYTCSVSRPLVRDSGHCKSPWAPHTRH
eukprot:COSAG02_NODE_4707_length_5074_cov_3.193311_1_plen_149_part_00